MPKKKQGKQKKTTTKAKKKVRTRLARAVRLTSNRVSLSLDASARDYIEKLIVDATDRMVSDKVLGSRKALRRAEKAFAKLIKRTAVQVRDASTDESPVLVPATEASIRDALSGLCPLWPIC